MKVKWLFLSNIIYVILQWGIISILTKQYSAFEVGSYFFNLALAAPIFLFFSLKLPTFAVTHTSNDHDKANLFITRILTSTLSIIVTLTIGLIFFYKKIDLYLLLSISLFKFLENHDDLRAAFYQKEMKFKQIFKIKVQRGLLFFMLVLISSFQFENLMTNIMVSTLIYILFWAVLNFKEINFNSYDYEQVLKYFVLGLPLGMSVAISSLVISASRLYVGFELGKAALSIFGAISYAVVAFGLIINVMGQYYLPLFTRYINNPKVFLNFIKQSQVIILILGVLGVIFSNFYGYFILKVLYNADIAAYYNCLTIIIAGTMFKASSALIGTSITATKNYSFQLKFSIFSSCLIFILLPFLMHLYNIQGAFLALSCVNFLEWLCYIVFSTLFYRRFFNEFTKENF